MLGSCSSWATAYYAYGYLEAKDNGWDASSGNSNYILSPSWVYNKISQTRDGSTVTGNCDVIIDWGVCTMNNMPYSEWDWHDWGNKDAWLEAPYHRAFDYGIIDYNDTNSIDVIKNLLNCLFAFL